MDGSQVPGLGKPAPPTDRLTTRLACAQEEPGALCWQIRNLDPAGAETRPPTPCRERVDRRPSQNLWGVVWLSCVTCSGRLSLSVREPLHGVGLFTESREALDRHSADGNQVSAPRGGRGQLESAPPSSLLGPASTPALAAGRPRTPPAASSGGCASLVRPRS